MNRRQWVATYKYRIICQISCLRTAHASEKLFISRSLWFPWFSSTSPSCFYFRLLFRNNCFEYFLLINTSLVTSFLFAAQIAFQFTEGCHLLCGLSSRQLHLTALTQSLNTDLSTNLASAVPITTFIPTVRHSKLDQDTINFWVRIFTPGKCRIVPQ